jgi:hypothetical protein
MIIKFEVNGAWQFFDDVDSFMYRRMGAHDCLEFHEPADGVTADYDIKDVIDYTETMVKDGELLCNGSSEGYPNRVLLTFMNSKQTAQSQVVAYSPIYLMNDNGKTIEII